jgi:hypothetical protein
MPLDIRRLLTSRAWIEASYEPKIGHALMSLWCESWHQIPAASLPDNDKILAHLAMCDSSTWAEIRERVMADWRLCSDGRWYHPFVAEKAKEAWTRKLQRRDNARTATERRLELYHERMRQLDKVSERRRENRLKNQKVTEGQRDVNATSTLRDERSDVTTTTGTGTGTGTEKKEKTKPPRALRDDLATLPLLELSAALPPWLAAKDWRAWVEHRKKIKRPLTKESEERTIAKLDDLRKQGHDPASVINESIVNGWQGLFALKNAVTAGVVSASATTDPTRGYR